MRSWLRRIGIVLLLVGAMSGARAAFVYFSEVPAGYRRIDFGREITEAVRFDSDAEPHIKDSLLKLEGHSIRITKSSKRVASHRGQRFK